ncbi:LacI family DNA-binding transcriptional regulator [Microbacterium sp. NPDC096154]|uniref:LacI family DNA-binding transcriptional regulator n=1 Tax=Microbacterium sp. NPDC096154 TaxID=3155549 RepID=UPI00331AA801
MTIDDVARAAGVHKATVSRALNPATQDLVSGDTVRRVKRVAERLGYVPNAVARSLRTRQSSTIGVVVPDLMNPIFPPLVRGVESWLQPRGYTSLVANTDDQDAIEDRVLESLLQRHVDGVVVASGRLEDQAALRRADAAGLPVVMANRAAADGRPSVTSDSAAGIVAAVAHLVGLGHRDILHLAGPATFSTTRERADAFVSAAVESGVVPRVVAAGGLAVVDGEEAMARVLAAGPAPTAVVTGNDLVALGAIHALRKHGLSVPGDVSVVGFNDMPFAADVHPALTTVHVPLHDIGVHAARLLLDAIEGGVPVAASVTLPVRLVVRESSGPVR